MSFGMGKIDKHHTVPANQKQCTTLRIGRNYRNGQTARSFYNSCTSFDFIWKIPVCNKMHNFLFISDMHLS